MQFIQLHTLIILNLIILTFNNEAVINQKFLILKIIVWGENGCISSLLS